MPASHSRRAGRLGRPVLMVLAAAGIGAAVAVATHPAPAPAATAPHAAIEVHFPEHRAAQVGETCLGTSSDMLLAGYGLDVPLGTFKAALYRPGWNQDTDAALLDRYLKPLGLKMTTTDTLTAAGMTAAARRAPVLLSVWTKGLPWWKVSRVQGAHEILVSNVEGDGQLRVWDPGFGRWFSASPRTLATATYYVMQPSGLR